MLRRAVGNAAPDVYHHFRLPRGQSCPLRRCRTGRVGASAVDCGKPEQPVSDKAVVGYIFYPNDVVDVASGIAPSKRGELEITTVSEAYLNQSRLDVELFGRGFAWLDTGTIDSLMEASAFVEAIQKRQGLKIAAIEEVAFRRGYISAEQLAELAAPLLCTDYGQYLETSCR